MGRAAQRSVSPADKVIRGVFKRCVDAALLGRQAPPVHPWSTKAPAPRRARTPAWASWPSPHMQAVQLIPRLLKVIHVLVVHDMGPSSGVLTRRRCGRRACGVEVQEGNK